MERVLRLHQIEIRFCLNFCRSDAIRDLDGREIRGSRWKVNLELLLSVH